MTNTPFPLELQNISCAFGEGPRHVSALNNVSLAVNPGELVAIMGPSGSGKSTLLNVAGLLQRATSGHVLIDGASASDLNAKRAAETRRRHIGVIFQNYNLIPTLTVGENVGLPLELDGIIDREAVAIALREVGLEGFDNRFPEEISGGQAQRVAIARALIGSRKILLADEPTGALDTSTGDAVLRVLRQRVDSGAAGLLVTHEPRFAAWADRTIMLRDGEIQ
ncbi:macrolide ABC transporter ATP-binding protein [[Brevibacterium] flavum]|uniref:Macrolide ABC transporter ATP-binding protein n=1 Tax=[Brevibacterium] flavum TaxID=92706 RepID=A0A0F6Z4L1_9CORY|nr:MULTISPECIES: ABC transporter ATP-binding protein [Corynebacterium]AJE66881.1 macrolide ABC transporter ATP-binding protein [Corynebacterium glutamicum]AKF26887.1 macrolide ABC transporter ATP-binding protein [[Brevibacterium] flavum]ANE07706.1 macrolide ABC transporter ATP-binding protein [Corynebacterium glutamicum]AST20125.1 ABC transporter ATP-binding protein [Corynebacterium glutamicum ATCC 14067]KEI22594.1 macrolide ABC transporter ATP-binding protein [Corynebacterium glutamicum ATCC 